MAAECVEYQPNFNEGVGRALLGDPTRFEIASNGETIDLNYEQLCRQLGRTSLESFEKILPPESDPFKEMGDIMKENIIGQDAAVDTVMEALSNVELRDPNRPVASFIFMGPTGVGKTELSKELDRVLHEDDGIRMLRLDCSDYAEKATVSRLTGASPMYVGREQVAELCKAKVEGKYRLIVFDEIEKAAPELRTLLLQILEEGELTINNGDVVSFRDSILIMTSNVGADRMQHELSNSKIGFKQGTDAPASKDALESIVMKAAKERFLPEFLNRIDHKVVFHSFNDDQLSQVLDSHVARSNERYLQSGIKLSVTEDLRRAFVLNADDRREYGARHIVREFDKKVETRLSKYVQLGSIKRGSHVYAYLDTLSEENSKDVPFAFFAEPDEEAFRAYKNAQKKKIKAIQQSLASQEKNKEKDTPDNLQE